MGAELTMSGPKSADAPLIVNNFAEKVNVGGVPITTLDRAGWLAKMVSDVAAAQQRGAPPKFGTTAKGQTLVLIQRDPEFAAALRKADSIAPDGVPILWGAKYFARRPIKERIATTDVFHDFARLAQKEGISFFLFGGTPEINAVTVARVQALYPDLKIAGARHGFFKPADEDKVIAEIVATKPDIVWVGLGIPFQEKFVARNIEKFTGVTWVKTCGGLFDFIAGKVSRAPGWMQYLGLEWLYRVALEPRRLFWRYASTNGPALYFMVKNTPRQDRITGRTENL